MNRRASVLLAVALLAAGCVVYNYEAKESETRTWPAAQAGTIDATVDNGAVTVTAAADTVVTAVIERRCKGSSQADADSHLADVVVTDSLSGGTLYLRHKSPQPNPRTHAANVDFSAPAAAGLSISAANGAVTVTGVAGSTVIQAANGAVETHSHEGDLRVGAPNGAIRADFARLDSLAIVILDSDNGTVTLSLPADASLRFDAWTSNGTVRVEGFTNVSYTKDEAKHKTGTIGTGAAAVTLSSANGSVTIRVR